MAFFLALVDKPEKTQHLWCHCDDKLFSCVITVLLSRTEFKVSVNLDITGILPKPEYVIKCILTLHVYVLEFRMSKEMDKW